MYNHLNIINNNKKEIKNPIMGYFRMTFKFKILCFK